MKDSTPWMHGLSKEEAWLDLDKVYLIMNSNQKARGEGTISSILGLEDNETARYQREWILANGDPKSNEDWVNFKAFRNSPIVEELEEKFELELAELDYRKKLSEAEKKRSGKPWRKSRVIASEKFLYRWSLLDELYDWWLNADTYVNEYGVVAGKGPNSAANALGFKTVSCFRTMLDWIKANGNPRDNEDWVKFKEEFNDRIKAREEF